MTQALDHDLVERYFQVSDAHGNIPHDYPQGCSGEDWSRFEKGELTQLVVLRNGRLEVRWVGSVLVRHIFNTVKPQ